MDGDALCFIQGHLVRHSILKFSRSWNVIIWQRQPHLIIACWLTKCCYLHVEKLFLQKTMCHAFHYMLCKYSLSFICHPLVEHDTPYCWSMCITYLWVFLMTCKGEDIVEQLRLPQRPKFTKQKLKKSSNCKIEQKNAIIESAIIRMATQIT